MTAEVPVTERPERRPVEGDPADLLLALLAHPSIASTEDIVRTYDHEVLGNTVVRPYEGRAGDGPSDGTVVVPYGTTGPRGVAVGVGVNALHGRLDPYRMAVAVHDEAVRNVVAVGADPDRIAVLDNFSWGDPTVPERLGALVEAARGCHDAAVAHATPFISGKDSLYNEYVATDGTRRPIPHTLVISAIGIVPDVSRVVTTAPPAAGEVVVLVGDTRDELGGSHLDDVLGTDHGGEVPGPDPGSPVRYRALHRAMSAGLVTACHDLSEGGLAVAAAEMCIAGRVGMALELEGDATVELFSESLGRLLLTVRAGNAEEVLGAIPGARTVGIVRSAERLEVRVGGEITVDLAVEELVEAARGAEW